MISAKTLKLFTAAIIGYGAFTACRPQPAVTPDPVPLTLSAQVISLDYEDDSLWGQTAELGVFVTESGTANIVGENSNVRYTACFSTGIISVNPADESIILPEDGLPIDIAAYYPYTSDLVPDGTSGYACHVDLSDQKSLKPEILLLAKVENRNSALHSAMLTLKPAFAKLKVSLQIKTDEAEVKSSETKTEVRIGNIPCKADIDVLSGRYVSYGSPESTVLTKPVETAHVYEAIVLAQDTPEDTMLSVNMSESSSTDNENVSVTLKELIPEIEANKQYDITITVSPDGIEATLVGMSDFFVSDWKEDFEDVNGEVENN